ncbi:MAG: RluA family pseudouridine synthase [Balneolales bacterium]|nr:RluA family pseudouridine synthase [Balneolales bacterium]
MQEKETHPFFTPVFEDNHLLVVHKLPNVPVQEDASGDPDLLNALKAYLKTKYNKPGNVFLGMVHRLDRPASGLMVFARTSKAASRLSEQFRLRQLSKKYLAVVQGTPPPQADLRDFLVKDAATNKVSVVAPGRAGAKEARLSLKLIKHLNGLSLIEIDLETGRSHQIRVQCAHAGFPLWGDYKYGDGNQPQGRTLALLSARIGFTHPTLKKEMTFSADFPQDSPWNRFDAPAQQQEFI